MSLITQAYLSALASAASDMEGTDSRLHDHELGS